MNVSYGEKRKEFRNVNYWRLKPLEMSEKRKKPKTGHYPQPLSPYTRGGAYKLTAKLVVFGVCRVLRHTEEIFEEKKFKSWGIVKKIGKKFQVLNHSK